jgi:hypothetical protein
MRRAPATIGTAVAALIGIMLLTGCASPTNATAYSANAAANVAAKRQPTAEPTTPPPGIPHPAAVAPGTGAPVVHRSGELPDAKKQTAAAENFTSKVSYPDGISLEVSGFTRGVIKSHGAGIITGAPYIVFTAKLTNGSKTALDLSSVVATLRYGKAATVAAPVYDEVNANDFWGTVKAGGSSTAVYAFQFPKAQADASLYMDLDGAHKAATFTGSIPQ